MHCIDYRQAFFWVPAANQLWRFRTNLFLVKMLRMVHNLVGKLKRNPFPVGGKGARERERERETEGERGEREQDERGKKEREKEESK